MTTHDNGAYVQSADEAQKLANDAIGFDAERAVFWETRATNLLLRALLEALNAR